MNDATDTGPSLAGTAVFAVIRSMISVELASEANRLQQASSGGGHGAHQV